MVSEDEQEQEPTAAVTSEPEPTTLVVSEKEEKQFDGVVSAIYDTYGLIDGEIYFSADCLETGLMPDEGSSVHVVAQRKHGMGGWLAVSVTPVNSSDPWSSEPVTLIEEDAQPDSQITVGAVTAINGPSGVINNSVEFELSSIQDDYVPCVGDWVKVHLHSDSGTWHAETVEPLRVRHFEGRVVSMNYRGFGFIEQDIYFTSNVCGGGYVPRRSDVVRGRAVETSGRSVWRAIQVEPLQRVAPKYVHLLSEIILSYVNCNRRN